jgi:excisionase family DNA binding protein
MSQEEFFSFEQALDHLRLKEEELRRLVSEGEIRAFRDGETMKLRKRDVEELGRELMGGEVIDLSDADEDLVFEDDGDLLDPGMATEELTAADTLVEDLDELGTLELDAEEDLEDLEDLEDEDDDEELVAAAPAVD